jgi:hypothetical protein
MEPYDQAPSSGRPSRAANVLRGAGLVLLAGFLVLALGPGDLKAFDLSLAPQLVLAFYAVVLLAVARLLESADPARAEE